MRSTERDMNRSKLRSAAVFGVSVALLAACGGGSSAPQDAGPYPASCQQISDACHHVDPGSGPIHDCHETAHDVATIAACEAVLDECVELCHAAAGDGGTHDYEDGGAHDHEDGDEH
jgi:hypothetical protein